MLPTLLSAGNSLAADPGNTISSQSVLRNGQYVRSKNGVFIALMQDDANLVFYRATGPANLDHGALWSDGKTQPKGAYFASMQGDGNLVVYHGQDMQHRGAPIWASLSDGQAAGSYFLDMQDDGNLVVYQGSSEGDRGAAVWDSAKTDSLTDFENIQKLKYHLEQAKIVSTKSLTLFSQTADNSTDTVQTPVMHGQAQVEEQSNWSDSITNTVGFKSQSELGIDKRL